MDASFLAQNLSRLTTGEVRFDDLSREAYSTAACLYRLRPLGIVAPRTVEEVRRVVGFLAAEGISVTARGAGSAVAGQSVTSGVIVDCARYLNRVLEFDPETGTVLVEPGVILAQLNRELRRFGRFFPPDPSSGDYCTLGGMIANNSAGPRCIRFGPTRDWVESLEVVLADGTTAELLPQRPEDFQPQSRLQAEIFREIPALLRHHQELIEQYRPRVKNSSGYLLWNLVDRQGRLDLCKLIVGSEGTLAVVTRARLRTHPLPAESASALLFFDELDQAGEAVGWIRTLQPWALEIMDHQFIHRVREHAPALRSLLPERAGALLLVEFAGGKGDFNPEEKLRELNQRLLKEQKLAFASQSAIAPPDQKRLWALRKAASPLLYRRPGPRRLTRFVEDIVIPPERLSEGIKEIQTLLSGYGTEAPILGHAGDGNLHLNPELNLLDVADRVRMQEIAEAVYGLVIQLGGSITGEHGDGILRAPYVKRQFGPLVPVFQEVKRIFDPAGVLNPGKILRAEDRLPLSHLKFDFPLHPAVYPPLRRLQAPAVKEILLQCHGCGLCRTYCPVFLATGREPDLPRAKVGILRALAQGLLAGEELFSGPAGDALLASCISCERCQRQCPTSVDTSRAMLAARLARLYSRPLSGRDRLLSDPEHLGRAAAFAPDFCTRLSRSRPGRKIGERLFGVRSDAALPVFTRDRLSLLVPGTGRLAGLAPSGRVLYYAGCLERRHDPEGELDLALQVLRRFHREVSAPDLPCCGLPRLMAGDSVSARAQAAALAQALRPWLDGVDAVLTSCPGCALMLSHHYPELLGDQGKELAKLTRLWFDYLEPRLADRLKEAGPASGPSRVLVWHQPCHQSALGAEASLGKILQSLPAITWAEPINQCCGLAGSFGLKTEHRLVSRAISGRLAQAIRESKAEAVVYACPACRIQIAGLGFRVKSPLALLAERLAETKE